MSSYLLTINSSTSTSLSGERRSSNSPVLSPKSKFVTKYDKLLHQISESIKTPRENENNFFGNLQPKKEKEHLKTFSSNLERKKENPLKQELFRAKFNLLTGKTLDNLNFSRQKKNSSPNSRQNKTYFSTERNVDRNSTFRELKNYLKKNEISFTSKLFKEYLNKKPNDNSTTYNKSNNFVAKIKHTFPEYMNLKTKGQSFILNSNTGSCCTSNQKINQLRNQINKI